MVKAVGVATRREGQLDLYIHRGRIRSNGDSGQSNRATTRASQDFLRNQ